MVVINAALINNLPTSLPSGVSIAYHVGAVDRATLIQNISVTISAGTATPNTFQISLTYAGITLAAFKVAYPDKISADGLTIVAGAFQNATLPAGFALPETVTTIGEWAFQDCDLTVSSGFVIPPLVTAIDSAVFSGVTFPAGFTIPVTVLTINPGSFAAAHLPAGFSIPSTTTIAEEFSAEGPDSFYDAKLPLGYEWHDEHGNRINDQTKPTPGCVVAPIARS